MKHGEKMKTLVIYYSRKGENYVNGEIKSIAKGNTEIIAGLAIHGADAAKSEKAVEKWALENLG